MTEPAALSVIQKAACEAVWRALQERDHDRTGTLLRRDWPEPVVRARIANFVTALPLSHLPKLVLPELETYGPLKGGFSERWSKVSDAEARWLAHAQAEKDQRAELRVSDVAHMWGKDVSTPGTSDSYGDTEAQGPRPSLQRNDDSGDSTATELALPLAKQAP